MKRLIIVGSPRTNGRSAHLAELLFEANIDEHPEDELFLVPVSEIEVGPCIGCNACRRKTPVTFKGDDGTEVTEERHRCVFDDDMQTVYDLLDDADELVVVSPVFFSGAPAPMKCVIDRLQPYFWARDELRRSGGDLPRKRPLVLHVIGEGGDPHGYDALVSEVKASFALADFGLARLLDWVGKITPEGEVTAEADEVTFELPGASGYGFAWKTSSTASETDAADDGEAKPARKPRPKLDLSSGIWGEEPDEAPRPATGGKSKQAGGAGRGKAQQGKASSGKPGAAKAGGSGAPHSGKGQGKAAAAKGGRGKAQASKQAQGKSSPGKQGRGGASSPKPGASQGKRHGR